MEVNETEYQNTVIVMKRGCSTELLGVRHPLIPASSESGESAGYRDVDFHIRGLPSTGGGLMVIACTYFVAAGFGH